MTLLSCTTNIRMVSQTYRLVQQGTLLTLADMNKRKRDCERLWLNITGALEQRYFLGN